MGREMTERNFAIFLYCLGLLLAVLAPSHAFGGAPRLSWAPLTRRGPISSGFGACSVRSRTRFISELQCEDVASESAYDDIVGPGTDDDEDNEEEDEDEDGESSVEITRSALVAIIEDSWRRVTTLVPAHLLEQCEEELKGATSLLVLATVRKAADMSPQSKTTVESMFREADVNSDGQITFVEWFQWLGLGEGGMGGFYSNPNRPSAVWGNPNKEPSNEPSDSEKPSEGDKSDKSDSQAEAGGSSAENVYQQRPQKSLRSRTSKRKEARRKQKQQSAKEQRLQQMDPMVTGLAQVLGQAVTALQIASRLSIDDANHLSAAFVAGGTLAGQTDEGLTHTILSRLSPRTRDLVALALTLEASSIAVSSDDDEDGFTETGGNGLGLGYGGSSSVIFREIDAARSRSINSISEKMPKTRKRRRNANADAFEVSLIDGLNDGEYIENRGERGENVGEEDEDEDVEALIAPETRSRLVIDLGPSSQSQSQSTDVLDVVQSVDMSRSNNRPPIQAIIAPPIEDGPLEATAVMPILKVMHTDTDTAVSASEEGGDGEDTTACARERMKGEVLETELYAGDRIYDDDDDDDDDDEEEQLWDALSTDAVGVNSWLRDDEEVLGLGSAVDTLTEDGPHSASDSDSDFEKNKKNKVVSNSYLKVPPPPANNYKAFSSAADEKDLFRLANAVAAALPEKEEVEIGLSVSEEGQELSQGVSITRRSGTVLPPPPSMANLAGTGTGPEGSDTGIEQQYGLSIQTKTGADALDATLSRMGEVADDISRMRMALKDMDDGQAAMMRALLVKKSGGRQDVLSLAMALRATRLQHVARLSVDMKHQLAMETLQIWAPLSFQLGISAYIPELEVHSYVLLFPKSFGSFIGWYTQFKPIAKRLLRKFRTSLEKSLSEDAVVPLLASKVTLQSRLKSPSSAFKKMVKGSKQRHELYDMLGLRVIITQRQVPSESYGYGLEGFPNADVDMYEDFDYDEAEDDFDGYSETLTAELVDGLEISDENENNDLQGLGHSATTTAATSAAEQDFNSDSYIDDFDIEAEVVRQLGLARLDSGEERSGRRLSQEERMVYEVKDVLARLDGWYEDRSRFKNYIRHPKQSGYQSLHVTLVHRESGVTMEVQLRSLRMHLEAEYGGASHNRYKALLPAVVNRG